MALQTLAIVVVRGFRAGQRVGPSLRILRSTSREGCQTWQSRQLLAGVIPQHTQGQSTHVISSLRATPPHFGSDLQGRVAFSAAVISFSRAPTSCLHTSTGLHALKDMVPFTIHSKHQVPEDADLQEVNRVFSQLAKDPLYTFSTLDGKSLDRVTYHGLKGTEDKALLAYAKLAEAEKEEEEEMVIVKDDDGASALYKFALLKEREVQEEKDDT